MTIAVCLKCGSFKTQALLPCPSCKNNPDSIDDQAKHFMATSHFRSEAELNEMANQIKAGKEVPFDPLQLEIIKAEIPNLRGWGASACLSTLLIILVIAIPLTLIFLLLDWLMG